MLANFIVVVIILVIIVAAVAYIVKAKKSGAKCIGCPDAGVCGKEQTSSGGCCGGGSDCHCGDK